MPALSDSIAHHDDWVEPVIDPETAGMIIVGVSSGSFVWLRLAA